MGTYVRYTSKILVAKKGLDFFPEASATAARLLVRDTR